MYGINQLSDGTSTEGLAEVIIGKQRNGPTGEARLQFIKDYARFENMDIMHGDIPELEEAPLRDEDLPI